MVRAGSCQGRSYTLTDKSSSRKLFHALNAQCEALLIAEKENRCRTSESERLGRARLGAGESRLIAASGKYEPTFLHDTTLGRYLTLSYLISFTMIYP